MLDRCFHANHEKMIEPYPAYKRLHELFRVLEAQGAHGAALPVGPATSTISSPGITCAWTGETVRRESELVTPADGERAGLHARRPQRAASRCIGDAGARRSSRATRARARRGGSSSRPRRTTIRSRRCCSTSQSAREAEPDAAAARARAAIPAARERVAAQLAVGARQPRAPLRRRAARRVAGRRRRVGGAPAAARAARRALDRERRSGCSRNSLRARACAPPTRARYLYRPYRARRRAGIALFFRDDRLSDLIGFEYSKWHGSDAAANFVGELEAIAADARAGRTAAGQRDPRRRERLGALPVQRLLLPRRSLRARSRRIPTIRTDDVRAITLRGERAAARPRGRSRARSPRLVAGSWVYGNFSTWIGSRDKNRAWDLLCAAKQSFDLVGDERPARRARSARRRSRQLAVCEGSDWFWWFGDYNPAHAVASFDRAVSRQPRAISTRCSSLPAPPALAEPIATAAGEPEGRRQHAPRGAHDSEAAMSASRCAAVRRARPPAGGQLSRGAGRRRMSAATGRSCRRCTAIPDSASRCISAGRCSTTCCERYPEDMALLTEMVARGQVELFGAGDTEPVLAAIPDRDRLGQIARALRKLERAVRRAPARRVADRARVGGDRGARARGVRHSLRDRRRLPLPLRRQERRRSSTATSPPRRTARTLDLFPISEALRYRDAVRARPRRRSPTSRASARGAGAAAIYFDDIEKFGIWPETYDWVYGKGWLTRFIERRARLRPHRDRGPSASFTPRTRTRGIVYLPTTSYIEMNEWTLPAPAAHAYADAGRAREARRGATSASKAFLRGGIWKNFVSRYPEANWMHKRMLGAVGAARARCPRRAHRGDAARSASRPGERRVLARAVRRALPAAPAPRRCTARCSTLEARARRASIRARRARCATSISDGVDELFLQQRRAAGGRAARRQRRRSSSSTPMRWRRTSATRCAGMPSTITAGSSRGAAQHTGERHRLRARPRDVQAPDRSGRPRHRCARADDFPRRVGRR